MPAENPLSIDPEYFEYIIAFNCTFNELYTASVIDHLKLEFIHSDSVSKYLNIIFSFYRKRGALPTPTEIKGYLHADDIKAAYRDVVTKFKTFDSQFNYEDLIENTERFIKERAVYRAVKDTVNEISAAGNVDASEILHRFDSACSISIIDNLGFDYFNQIDDHIKEMQRSDTYISTGYKWLDQILGGGFLESGRAVYAWFGATNSGKSILLGNIAANIVRSGKNVAIISLEMSEHVYSKRISSKLTDIPIGTLKDETDLLRSALENIRDNESPGRLFVKEFPPNSITPNHIKAYLKKLEQQKGIKIHAVVLDYLTLLKDSNGNTDSLYAKGKNVAEDIRALSYPGNFGCPFITALQGNRDSYDEADPNMKATGESIGIPQTIDFQGSIWSTKADKEVGIIHLGIQKSRFGVNHGTKSFRINYDTLSITESDGIFSDTDIIEEIDSSLSILSR